MALEWARLLQQQQDEGRLGLTPSFLIGALRKLPGDILGREPGRPELRALLEKMRDERVAGMKSVTIFECQNIVQPVAALSSAPHGDPIAPPDQALARLYVWPWVDAKRPVDFDWLLDALWDHYGEQITCGDFSYARASKRFNPFDRLDDDFIARAFVDSDEE